jgi:hypothetical protein
MTKTVIHTWIQKACNLPQTSFCGFGDMLRGAYGVYESCSRLGYDCIIDFSNHPVGQFFENITHPFSDIIKSNINSVHFNIFNSNEEIDNYIKGELESKDYIYFSTNCSLFVYNSVISEDCKKVMRQLLTPNSKFQEYITTYMPKEPYGVIHYRFGDHVLINKDDIDIYPAFSNLSRNLEEDTVLISDSIKFKIHVATIFPNKFIIFETKQCHIGISDDMEALRDTLFEFIIATRAKYIKTYSTYSWVSGFMNIVNKIYDVELFGISA